MSSDDPKKPPFCSKESPNASAKETPKASESSHESANPQCPLRKNKFFCCFLNHREQLIVYALLIIGLLLTFSANALVGGVFIGAVTGYYFSSSIIYFIRNLNQIFKGQDRLHYLILAVLAAGLFLDAPGIFVGALVVAAFKEVISSGSGK